MTSTAYDDILEYSSIKQFGDFRRVLVGKRGTIASGKLSSGMTLVFNKNKDENEELFEETGKEPINIVQKIGSRSLPGLVFDKRGYEELLRQVETRGEVSLSSLLEFLKFNKESEEEIWQSSTDVVKTRCLSKNLDKLEKETKPIYRMYGDNMQYLTIGAVEIETYQNTTEKYPLFLFSCTELNLKKLSAKIDTTGFMNFWLDKNVFQNEIARKRNNSFEVSMDNTFANQINTFSSYMNDINLAASYKTVRIDPAYMALQIVTGFEAEYVDPAWSNILAGSGDHD